MVNPNNARKNKYMRDTYISEKWTSARKKRKMSVYNISTSPKRNFSIINENINSQVPDLIKDIDIDYSTKKSILMLI